MTQLQQWPESKRATTTTTVTPSRPQSQESSPESVISESIKAKLGDIRAMNGSMTDFGALELVINHAQEHYPTVKLNQIQVLQMLSTALREDQECQEDPRRVQVGRMISQFSSYIIRQNTNRDFSGRSLQKSDRVLALEELRAKLRDDKQIYTYDGYNEALALLLKEESQGLIIKRDRAHLNPIFNAIAEIIKSSH